MRLTKMRRVENLTPQYGLLVLLLPHANEVVGVVVGVKKKKTRHRSIWSFHSEIFYSIQVKVGHRLDYSWNGNLPISKQLTVSP